MLFMQLIFSFMQNQMDYLVHKFKIYRWEAKKQKFVLHKLQIFLRELQENEKILPKNIIRLEKLLNSLNFTQKKFFNKNDVKFMHIKQLDFYYKSLRKEFYKQFLKFKSEENIAKFIFQFFNNAKIYAHLK